MELNDKIFEDAQNNQGSNKKKNKRKNKKK